MRLPETRVFENLKPCLYDMGFDSIVEFVVIESSMNQGARLAIYDRDRSRLCDALY